MLNRKTARAAARNARAIEWVRTHTIQDLEDLAGEMQTQGEDVRDIIDLLGELREIDAGLAFDAGIYSCPVEECAETG